MMNKMKAFEVATWPCSEEYVKNQSILNPAFELLTGPEGPSGLTEIFYGIEVGKSNAYGVLNWDSTEAHAKFNADQDATLKFVKMFESSAKDGIPNGTIIHASWEEDAALASLRAPFTELRKFSPKGSTSTTIQAIHDALDKYVAATNKVSGVVATYGHVIEEPEKLILIVGREVVCVHAWLVHKLI